VKIEKNVRDADITHEKALCDFLVR